ncbi:late blight resistance homolog R1C-3 [Olea europaea subsp. europaea]|uniref:Late blight resistance homolog R1C-3 n=1 Tax=Olea europaea subsp. europaea TaxID=158383 RepID=A0A8S0PA42_OLEEU|nr:late blight resistance homolog R1C-3 [Olea europaea subsp. europaea]
MAYASVTSLPQTMEQILHADGHEILDKKLQIEYLQEQGNILIPDEDQSSFRQLISAVKYLILAVRENILIQDGDQSFIRRLNLAVQNLIVDHRNQNLGPEYQLEKLLEEIDAITKKAMKMKSGPNDLLLKNSVPDGFLKVACSGKRTLIGFENDLRQIKDHFTGSSSKLKVVSIVGMGGIGKTTLTRNVYDDPLIAYHFDTRAWATVSAQYHVKDILNSMMVSTDKISRKALKN